jgi:putative Mn2+ efflux pump MntP
LTAFEGGMPLVGALAGAVLGRRGAEFAVPLAVVLLVVLGIRAAVGGVRDLRQGGADDDEPSGGDWARPRSGLALLAAGWSVASDELAVGVAAGAARLPLRLLAPALVVQALVLSCLGLVLGARLRSALGRYGELSGGLLLLGAAAVLALTPR